MKRSKRTGVLLTILLFTGMLAGTAWAWDECAGNWQSSGDCQDCCDEAYAQHIANCSIPAGPWCEMVAWGVWANCSTYCLGY